jgi:hypothetical protein
MKYPYHFDMQILLIYVFDALYVFQNLEDMLDMCRGYIHCRRQIHILCRHVRVD